MQNHFFHTVKLFIETESFHRRNNKFTQKKWKHSQIWGTSTISIQIYEAIFCLLKFYSILDANMMIESIIHKNRYTSKKHYTFEGKHETVIYGYTGIYSLSWEENRDRKYNRWRYRWCNLRWTRTLSYHKEHNLKRSWSG